MRKASQSKQVIGIRFGVKAGGNPQARREKQSSYDGCPGFEYVLEPMVRADERHDDFVLRFKGLKIHINAKSIPMVWGTEIDHSGSSDNLMGGFVFKNPNTKTSCGYGTSSTKVDKTPF